MKLYEFERAPNPRRVRFFIAEKGIDLASIERIQIDIGGGENRAAEFRQMNPMGTVPVLELDDGTALSETMAMSTFSITTTTMNMNKQKSEISKPLSNTSRSKSPSIPMLNTVRRVSCQLPKGWRVDERRAHETGLMQYKR